MYTRVISTYICVSYCISLAMYGRMQSTARDAAPSLSPSPSHAMYGRMQSTARDAALSPLPFARTRTVPLKHDEILDVTNFAIGTLERAWLVFFQ